MTCKHCAATNSITYDMTKTCCAARYIDAQIASVCRRYGHTRQQLKAEMVAQARGRRADGGEAGR